MSHSAPQTDGPERFARLFAQNQQSLLRYIMVLTGGLDEAQDVLQETSVALLRKIDEYDPSRPFLPWARRFAYFEVLAWRERDKRRLVVLSPDVLDLISNEVSDADADATLDARRAALGDCLSKLSETQRSLLLERYTSTSSMRSFAEASGRPVQTLYTQLKRLRHALMLCIDRAVTHSDGGLQ